jgi:Tfp pilus assembly protein PilF
MDNTDPEQSPGKKTSIRPRGFSAGAQAEVLAWFQRGRKLPRRRTPFSNGNSNGNKWEGNEGLVPADYQPEKPCKAGYGKRRSGNSPVNPRNWPAPVRIFALAVFGALSFAIGHHFGKSLGGTQAVEDSMPLEKAASQAQLAELESALQEIQNGLVPEAKNSLSKLVEEKTNIPSLALLAANAALLDGDVPLAERYSNLSIERGESVSNTLVLQAIIAAKLATTPEHKSMANPRIRIESLLERAIAADASNPRPFFELATLRRFEKRHGDALQLLESASNRLGQSDSIMAVNLAKELVKLEQLPDSDLAAAVPAGKDAQSLLCAAYAAARLGDPAKAAELVAQARTVVPPRTFFQLMKDPAFVPWRKEPALEKFFPKQKTN